MSYTFVSQLFKLHSNIMSVLTNETKKEELISKLQRNDYDGNFLDDNNNDPLLTTIGSISDLISKRKDNIRAVDNFNLSKYLGTWYEIARFNTPFEPEEVVRATAEYHLNMDGTLSVKNTGYYNDGKVEVVRGVGKVSCPGTTIGKLNVSFIPFIEGNYWIIMLDEKNTYSVVTSPDGKFLWILSRFEKMHEYKLEHIKIKLIELGFDISKLHYNTYI